MSRSLSAHLDTATTATTTEPWHLVQIGTLRLTDGPTTTWGGYTWLGYAGVSVDGQGSDGTGQHRGIVTLPNHDGAIGGMVLAGGADDVVCGIWQVYGPGPHAASDAALLVDGVVDDARLVGEWAELSYVSLGADARQLPRLRIAPPTFNHLLPEGTVLEWGGMQITVEGGS
jgi:hypothetical protein